jgi:putative inorganic carbon (hco3(-)) transporter
LFQQRTIFYLSGVLYAIIALFLVWSDQAFLSLVSLGFIAVFSALYYSEKSFLFLAFLTPLSVNIEEYTDSFGLFIPTEPLLFGFLILFLLYTIQKNRIQSYFWKHPIVLAVLFYLIWILFSSIASSHPVASFKFLLARLWFLIPMVGYGAFVFSKKSNIKLFVWLFTSAMMVAILYTLVVHASYSFGEKEGHWVMWPFFKDHTIYGAMVAFTLPLTLGLLFCTKNKPLTHTVLIVFVCINLIGLYFSYTRAAWLSVFAAGGVWLLIHFRVKFVYLVATTLSVGLIVLLSWNSIQISMSKNKSEHTTEDFGKKLQSATNVTTDASNLERLNRWSCALAMFEERPFFGFGPGTYAFEYARFQEPEDLTIISTNFGDAGNAHSEYLSAMSEMGVFGLLAILAIVSTLFYSGITLYYRIPKEDSELKIIILVMILSLTTYFVHAFLNNFLDTDKAAVPIWGFAACFIALNQYYPKKQLSN